MDKLSCDFVRMAETLSDSSVLESYWIENKGADISSRNASGKTPLMAASGHNKNLSIIQQLIELGADVNARDQSGLTALMYAAIGTNIPSVFDLLVKHGADVNARDKNGLTALMYMSITEHIDTLPGLKRLVKLGADVNARDRNKMTTLMYAVVRSRWPLLRKKIGEWGVPYNPDGRENGLAELSHQAHYVGSDPDLNSLIVEALVEMGVSIDAKDKNGWSALMYALGAGEDACDDETNGGELVGDGWGEDDDNQFGESEQFKPIAKTLVELGADVNLQDKKGWTPLKWIIKQKGRHLGRTHIEFLLTKGALVSPEIIAFAEENGLEVGCELYWMLNDAMFNNK